MRIAVLIVEDRRDVRLMIEKLLDQTGGFHVCASVAGESEATAWMAHPDTRWDLAILDLMIGEGSGFSLIRRCKLQSPGGRIVVFSEHASPAIRAKCLQIGADEVFAKRDVQSFVKYLRLLASSPPSGGSFGRDGRS